MKREITTGGVIYKKNKRGISILLENNKGDNWSIFFDSLENEEGIEQKAKEIAQKRSGIEDIRVIADLGRLKYWIQSGQDLVHRRVYSFLYEMPQTSDYLPEEDQTRHLKWFEPDDALQIITSKDEKLTVKKALEKLKVSIQGG